MATTCQFCSSARLHIRVTGIGANPMRIVTEYRCDACGKDWVEVTSKKRPLDNSTLRPAESA